MSSFKQLNKADVTTVPYAANKQWVYRFFPKNQINVYRGTYSSSVFSLTEPILNQQYQRFIYDTINHMFYQSYDDRVLDTGSLMFNINTYESASQQRPSNFYFDYNISPYLVKNFPTGDGDEIEVLVINPQVYGSKILPSTFKIELDLVSSKYAEAVGLTIPNPNGTGYVSVGGVSGNPTFEIDSKQLFVKIKIVDDGYGNLYDVSALEDDYVLPKWPTINYFDDDTPGITEPTHIGNIFYAHGIVVITNPLYLGILTPPTYYINVSGFDVENYLKWAEAVGVSNTTTIPGGGIGIGFLINLTSVPFGDDYPNNALLPLLVYEDITINFTIIYTDINNPGKEFFKSGNLTIKAGNYSDIAAVYNLATPTPDVIRINIDSVTSDSTYVKLGGKKIELPFFGLDDFEYTFVP